MTRTAWVVWGGMALWAVVQAGSTATTAEGPRYTSDGQLLRPERYREWVFLSSGMGMTYGPAANAEAAPPFDNVFVNPAAYRAFRETGRWPEKTMFILEIRSSESHGSINRAGRFQRDVIALEAAVKDTARFPGNWAYFDFPSEAGVRAASAKAIPQTASCYQCHGKNTAVENTFVQFYPELYEIAERKRTLNAGFARLAVSPTRLQEMISHDGWAAAEQALRDAQEREPEATVLLEASLANLGSRLLREMRTADAVKLLEWAVTRHPRSANLRDLLAQGYESSGQATAAIRSTERALEMLASDGLPNEERRTRLEGALRERLVRLRK